MRRLYADRLVVISAVLILLFSVLFAVVQSSADPANKMATPRMHCVQEIIRPPTSSADGGDRGRSLRCGRTSKLIAVQQ
jgi:hypothetical protein